MYNWTKFYSSKPMSKKSDKHPLFAFAAVSLLLLNLLGSIPNTALAKMTANQSAHKNSNKPLAGTAAYREVSDSDACYLLNRSTFGPRPGEIQALKSMGFTDYINQQLRPQSIAEAPIVTAYMASEHDLTASPLELYMNYGPPAVKAVVANSFSNSPDDKKDAQKIIRERERDLFKKVAQLRLMRALYSPRQLEEVMTDFWFNHFNVYAQKGLDRFLVGVYEDKAIRPYALGKFRDLLGATCHHAAMLFYLDNWQNSAPNLPGNMPNQPNGPRRFSGLNENYARELMELHTLGVDGGYTQQDVIQLARILTGLGLPPQGRRANAANVDPTMGDFFDERRHDFSDKMLLGHPIKGTGADEIDKALDILAAQPATAQHICYELAQYFVADKPPATLVSKLAARFKQTNGDIKAVLSDLFTSPEFWNPRYRQAKYKNPFRYTVSTLRATNAQPTDYQFIMGFLRQQGMPIYGCITPDGYKNTKEAWLNSDTLLKRIGFATSLGLGRLPQLVYPLPDYTVVGTIFGATLSKNTVRVITKAPPRLKLALLLGSPEFMLY
jgi:uncharacterized protein (DUF1800 family)